MVGLSVAFLVSFGLSNIQIPIHHVCVADFVIGYSWLS